MDRYERVLNVSAQHGLFEIITTSASMLFREIGRPLGGDKYESVVAAVQRVENVRREVDVPGGQVRVINRPLDENEQPQWLFQATDGVELAAPQVKEALTAELSAEFSQYGTPWADRA